MGLKRHYRAARPVVLSLLLLTTLAGCGTLPNGRGWGEGATLFPGWERMEKAAYNLLVSPLTWGPAVGAAVLQIDGWDRHLSNWAAEKTPVFGSRTNAENFSDYLLFSAGAAYGTTALATPSGEPGGAWVTNKIKGFIVGGAAVGISAAGVDVLNTPVRRERPDSVGRDSFPSGHATLATSFATLAGKNLATMGLPGGAETTAGVGLGVIAAGTAWARVEAKRHYPSDVLAGIALGHFISGFVNDAFLGSGNARDFTPEAELSKEGFYLRFTWSFTD